MSDQKRSPRYPSIGVAEAAKLARATWDAEKRTAVSPEVLVKAWGHTSLNGPSRSKLASMHQYGLIEDRDHGVRLSDLGMKLANHPEESGDYRDALKEAAMSPELFKELLRTHADASEAALRSFLVLSKHFSPAGAAQCAKTFKANLSVEKLGELGYGRDEEQHEVPETQVPDSFKLQPPGLSVGNKKPTQLATQILAISIPRQLSVDIAVKGDELKREDLAKIKSQFNRWIEGLEEAFEE
jgi:hypothetical protein